MKSLLTIILSTITLLCVGQIATLDIRNPAPRISDGVDVSVSLEKRKIKKTEGPKSADQFRLEYENQLGSGKINFHTQLLDTGLVKIGPFTFKVNRTKFTTDAITIRVYPDLPKMNDGIWLRLVTFRDEDFVILEQRVSHSWRSINNGHSLDINADGVNFSGLDLSKVYDQGVELEELGSNTSSKIVQDEVLGSGTVSYKRTQYKVTKRDTFKGMLKITKDLFLTYPIDVELVPVEIR